MTIGRIKHTIKKYIWEAKKYQNNIKRLDKKYDKDEEYIEMRGAVTAYSKCLVLLKNVDSKETPKKPKEKMEKNGEIKLHEFSISNFYYVCPNCGKTIKHEKTNYCPSCGQHLDWKGTLEK